jgi:cytochrome c oxidase assembly factor CtaG
MNPALEAAVGSWPDCPWLVAGLAVSLAIYLRGWHRLRRRDALRWSNARLLAYCAGLLTIFVALASPIEPFTALLFSVHMVQHVLLTMAAPPLLWLAWPLLPMLSGMPAVVRDALLLLVGNRAMRQVFQFFTRPWIALSCFVSATWFWHVPALYELAQRDPVWHYLEHACFFGTAMLFWYAIVLPFPSRGRTASWWPVPMLLAADVQNTVLSAVFAFADRVLYPSYAEVPRIANWSALSDQAAAGVLMWVPGSIVFLVPLVAIGMRAMRPPANITVARRSEMRLAQRRIAQAARLRSNTTNNANRPSRPLDLLRAPPLGRFLAWRHARLAVQVPMFLVAAAIVVDGLWGPQQSPMNLAGVVPWIHWRGFVIGGLLIAGNVACMACPFTAPRSLARWLLASRWQWPRWLRSKWLAIALLVAYFWAYETLAIWSRPSWTAWIVISYFVAAFVVDGLFQPATFCKYVCPIGQFNFVQSLMSPFEIKTRDVATCAGCTTRDCLQGGPAGAGCELQLFQPKKLGNLDCTFCLACVHACPRDNVGIITVVPGLEVLHDAPRSGIGRLSRRTDIAALVVVLVFGAFVNAAGMVAPVLEWEDRVSRALGLASPLIVTSVLLLAALLLLPGVAITTVGALSRWCGGGPANGARPTARFVLALVPIGLAMWVAHYGFHFLVSPAAFLPPMQRFAADFAGGVLGDPQWAQSCCVTPAGWILKFEIVALGAGLLGSLYLAYQIACSMYAHRSLAVASLAPWGALIVALYVVGIWIVLQPMEMRGVVELMR